MKQQVAFWLGKRFDLMDKNRALALLKWSIEVLESETESDVQWLQFSGGQAAVRKFDQTEWDRINNPKDSS